MGSLNVMNWDCQKDGCFNIKKRLKFWVFSKCFPGNINFSDVDGIVEIDGKALMLEWKSDDIDLPKGQRIMYTRLTRDERLTVMILCGNAETMEVSHLGYFFAGKYSCPAQSTTEQAREWISSWVEYAKKGQ